MWTVGIYIAFLGTTVWLSNGQPQISDCPTVPVSQVSFHEILVHYNATESGMLTTGQLLNFTETLIKRIQCETDTDSDLSCVNALCVDGEDLVTLTVSNMSRGMEEAEFGSVSSILLYHLLNLQLFCHSNVNLNETVEYYRSELIKVFSLDNEIKAEHLQASLINFNESLTLSDANHHDDAEEDHPDRDSHSVPVYSESCLSAGLVFDKLGVDPEDSISTEHIDQVATVLLHQLFEGSAIMVECRLLPRPSYFLEELFQHQPSISESEFSGIVTEMLGDNEHTTTDTHGHKRRKREADHDDEEKWAKCYSTDELLAIHGVEDGQEVSKVQFTRMCPSLVQTKLSGVCQGQADGRGDTNRATLTAAERYGYGTLATVIICLCSLIGVCTIPLAKKKLFDVLMDLFRGLAIGTLLADPLLHLIPQVFGLHGHDEEEEMTDHVDEPLFKEFIGFSLIILAGIYAFYLLELIMTLLGHSHCHDKSEPSQSNGKVTQTNSYDNEGFSSPKSGIYEVHGLPIHEEAAGQRSHKKKGWNVLALMIVLGDGIHNFVDGLAIGAAFSNSLTEGLAVSITVFCHEFPHEFGDFAVLVSSGLSFTKALGLNLLSSLTALIGLYVGLVVTTDEVTTRWIFGFTAGLFLYIALVNLIPDVIKRSTKGDNRSMVIIVTNIGMFVGAGIMLLLSIYEEKMQF